MAKINQLPTELLQKIFSEFLNILTPTAYKVLPLFKVSAEDLATLKAVSRTCRALHRAVEPLVWRHICIEAREFDRPFAGPSVSQLIALIRLWHARPDLAAHVHTIFVSWTALYLGQKLIQNKDFEFLSGLTRDLGLRLPDGWHEAGKSSGILAGIAVLLARNVRVLDLHAHSTYFFDCIPAPDEIPVCFEYLTYVRLNASSPRNPSSIDICPLLRLAPNLTKLEAWPALFDPKDLDWSGITTLMLEGAETSATQVAGVIRSCNKLRDFSFFTKHDPSPSEIMTALSTHTSTLRRLNLYFINLYSDANVAIGSLAAFTGLEELSIPADNIGTRAGCTLRTLPQCLRLLNIEGHPHGHREDIEWLAGHIRAGNLPNLGEVRLPVWECDGDHAGPCRGTYVDEDNGYESGIDEHGSDWEYEDGEEDEACDGGKTVHELRALFRDAGVSCQIGPHLKWS
ncbi:Putative F-box domain, leucine-rich repeat domain superfamily, F-box-like domain superfamily [Colletotrichum destructivum]|uniref:F-box domain, leucine-rich repeat domain superfamily, F-box-like domain superfamily n=1 Tax=Colletotrichum destructivum TaxID=34406 RepID=A0AAX4IR76_9PEZI|nr:Putative F-box domain, leucine-rich repeat domain superfamily, F-box-like domain superfamily [Colletotrichum destructivum]